MTLASRVQESQLKTLRLMGRAIEFDAEPDDSYLETMSSEGPVDLQPIFETFCTAGRDVIDVGANIGITAAMAGVMASPGRVIAIEPVPATFGHLEGNLRRSGLTNVVAVRAAASEEAGEVSLVVRPRFGFAAFVGYEGVLNRYEEYAEFSAPARPVDSLVEEFGLEDVGFIKIDTEGYELEVLRGSGATLDRCQPVVFLEANNYCLNIFRRKSLVDFTEEILARFPVVCAVDTQFAILDLTNESKHSDFFHENVVNGRFPNLLCGFSDRVRDGLSQMGATFV